MYVCVFFTLTDRGSTIRNNTYSSIKSLWAVLRDHQKVVLRRQKRTTFDVKNSTYFTFYVGHSTPQTASLYYRITHDVQPHTSQQLHSVQQLTMIFTIVRYFEYCTVFKNQLLHRGGRLPVQRRCSTHHVAAIFE